MGGGHPLNLLFNAQPPTHGHLTHSCTHVKKSYYGICLRSCHHVKSWSESRSARMLDAPTLSPASRVEFLWLWLRLMVAVS